MHAQQEHFLITLDGAIVFSLKKYPPHTLSPMSTSSLAFVTQNEWEGFLGNAFLTGSTPEMKQQMLEQATGLFDLDTEVLAQVLRSMHSDRLDKEEIVSFVNINQGL
jgi:hypothetical protein